MKGRLNFFSIDQRYEKFQEFDEIPLKRLGEAIEESVRLGTQIELYYTRDPSISTMPDVGFVFDKGVYRGHGLGSTSPGTNEYIPWLWAIHEEAEKYIGRDGREMESFFIQLP